MCQKGFAAICFLSSFICYDFPFCFILVYFAFANVFTATSESTNEKKKKVSIPVREPYGSDKYQRKPSSLSKISSHHPLNPLAVPQISSNFHTVGSL